ncbi:MAG: FHA domain-containing protein [Gemmataceae bacterium]
MIVCPFCHYENEDGALFCERCSSDLSGVAPAPAPAAVEAVAQPEPLPPIFAEPVPVSEPLPFAQPLAMPVGEAVPLEFASPLSAEVSSPSTPPGVPPHLEAPQPPPAPATASPSVAEYATAQVAPEPVVSEPVPPASMATAAAAAAPAEPPAPAATAAPTTPPAIFPLGTIPPGAQPRLQVLRGQKRNVEYPLYEGLNYIGRADEKPVDIDLEEQEPPDRIWCSRQHAVITFEGNSLTIEDLNSANGTYVNRTRVYPGQQKPLAVNDIVQIGNVQLKVII